MIALGSAALAGETRHHRVLENGFSFHRSEWMRSDPGPGLSPTVFLVEQPPNVVLAPHFHTQNQFQVIKEGSGTLGKHALGPGCVHYAGAFTGYGPLVAGPAGLSYFTIRAVYETGANFLPAARDRLRRGPKRNAHGPVHAPLAVDALRGLASARRVPLIAPQDGLEAYALQLPPLSRLEPIDARGSGQFQLVLAGALETPQGRLRPWESRYLSPSEDAGGCTAGASGVHLLVLQMPAVAPEYSTG
ncbi:hypothetical protein [Variovorax sp. RA8]|uniref:hypothetical protein n=1 Tax=Variovorax sp. (strain JCM 16519 / RA8) TaxID=662548 RepID=UPI001318ABDB|nr:hypothetical protein [Variovorax sp. RA8]VTU26747.1 hypothetical protein RA8CHR_03404 [Variovorax sp. RA8]